MKAQQSKFYLLSPVAYESEGMAIPSVIKANGIYHPLIPVSKVTF